MQDNCHNCRYCNQYLARCRCRKWEYGWRHWRDDFLRWQLRVRCHSAVTHLLFLASTLYLERTFEGPFPLIMVVFGYSSQDHAINYSAIGYKTLRLRFSCSTMDSVSLCVLYCSYDYELWLLFIIPWHHIFCMDSTPCDATCHKTLVLSLSLIRLR